MATPPPATVATAPDVVDRAFADTSDASSVVCGSPADSGREDEAVDREDGEPGRVERRPLDAAEHQRRDDGDQAGAQHVGPQQHLTTAPPVQPHPGEGADQGVGEQQDREPGGDVDGSAARWGLNSTVPASAAWKTPSPNWAATGCRAVVGSRRGAAGDEPVVSACATPVTLGGAAASARSPPGREHRIASAAPTLTWHFHRTWERRPPCRP